MKKVKCLNCGKKYECEAITVEHGYGSPYDMQIWELCSLRCLAMYIIEKITKDKK